MNEQKQDVTQKPKKKRKIITTVLFGPIYLGRYASKVPVVVTGNAFETVTSIDYAIYVQDHSNYGVSVDASNNTFAQ